MKEIYYLDNAATTPVYPEVLNYVHKYFSICYHNPSSIYALDIKNDIEDTRHQLLESINASDGELYFTSGGTESDNWALIGVCEAYKHIGNHIITTKIEHHAILNTCEYLENLGYDVTYLDVDENGKIDIDNLKSIIRPETIMISIMFANNEIGTIQDIKEIGKVSHDNNIVFHTDAVQAYGHIPIDVDDMNIDLMSVSGHKFGALKGSGFLYVRNGIRINPIIFGGRQEHGMRSGTENVPAIISMGKAYEINMSNSCDELAKLSQYILGKIYIEIDDIKLNGLLYEDGRLANNINIYIKGVPSESLVSLLSVYNILCSGGSACASHSNRPSHVLEAIGLSEEEANCSIRLTIGSDLTYEDADYIVAIIAECVNLIRTTYEMEI